MYNLVNMVIPLNFKILLNFVILVKLVILVNWSFLPIPMNIPFLAELPKKSIRRCQIEDIIEGYKRAIDEIRGPIAKNGFSGQNPKILPKKKCYTSCL